MKDNRMKDALENIAHTGVPENTNLWPGIESRIGQRSSLMQTLRAKPVLVILIVLLALSLLTGVVYAIGRLTGYIPGVGFVQKNSLRMLADPVSQAKDAITVSVEQVFADSERTIIIYKTEGLTIAAANSQGEGGGNPFGSVQLLRLPDGSTLEGLTDTSGAPEPLLDGVKTEGGWPNYAARLVYPPISSDVNELTLLIPVLQNMPVGAAAENWEITFQLKPAPTDIAYAPVIEFTPGPQDITPVIGETSTPALSNIATLNGITLQLDNVIELEDGYVFTGNLSWDDSVFPTGKGMISEAVMPVLTDANGQAVPVEEVPLDGSNQEHKALWSYRTNNKAFAGPLVLSVSSIKTTLITPAIDFAVDFGTDPQIGQTRDINQDFVIEGQSIRLLSIGLVALPESCQGVGVNFNFSSDFPGIFAEVTDVLAQPPAICSGGGGGGDGGGGDGGAYDPRIFSTSITTKDMPTGVHHYAINTYIPYVVNGLWQVTWTPPLTSEPTLTPAAGVCLTRDKWNELSARNDPLPSGLGGKLVTTIDEGGLLPAIYVSGLDGADPRKIDIGAWPSLSTDGTRLAYSIADGIHVLDLSSGENPALGTDGYRIIWSPDNTRMMYTTTFTLNVVNADGSGLQKIDTGAAQVISPTGWFPDNQTIVYAVMGGDGFTFTTYNLQSRETKKLFTIQNKAGYGAISSDGQWIVFADRIFGANNWGIFISRLDGSDRRLIAEPDIPTGFSPVWSPDGQWLVITGLKNDGTFTPMLVNPFNCEAARLNNVNGSIEGWSP